MILDWELVVIGGGVQDFFKGILGGVLRTEYKYLSLFSSLLFLFSLFNPLPSCSSSISSLHCQLLFISILSILPESFSVRPIHPIQLNSDWVRSSKLTTIMESKSTQPG